MALGLEGKPAYVGLIVGLLLAAAAVFGLKALVIDDVSAEIKSAEAQIKDLDTKIEQGRSAQRKLPQFREEVHRLELELEKLRRILPSTRNTEEIIKKIKSLVDQGEFTLRKLSFPPLGETSETYAEWPIAVSVDGRYHDLAILFNRLGNFSRIMNVENIKISAMGQQETKTISADFVAKTFVYVEQAAAAAEEGEENAKPGGGE